MKKTIKLCALLMAFFLTIGICAPSTQAAGKLPSYPSDGYLLEKLLSEFQFVTKQDVTMGSSGHTVGSIAVGGTLSLGNTFGDAGIVPSYISTWESGGLGNGWHGKVPVKSNVVYYGTANNPVTDPNWYQNAGYMDLNTGFTALETQSSNLTSGATTVNQSGGTITIDLTTVSDSEVKYVIPYADYAAATRIDLNCGNVDWFQTHICVISVTGVDGTALTLDGGSKMYINGTAMQIAFENMSGKDSEYGKQLNTSGMNLIWNFPDAQGTITAQGLGGHLVAPKATVDLQWDYEGGVIANQITGGAEGHFYPMSMYLSGNTDPEAGVTGAEGIFSKKAVSAEGDELPGAELKLTYTGASDLDNVVRKRGPYITKEQNNTVITWVSSQTPLTLSKLPDGTYVLSETAAPAGYRYTTDIEFKVESGKIYQKLSDGTYSTVENPTLTMVDEIKTGSITLDGTKTVVGNPPSETYRFEVKEGSKVVSTGSVTGAGKIVFTAISYEGPDAIGTHTYTVTEVSGSTDQMKYDTAPRKVTVVVSDDGKSDTLTVTLDETTSEKLAFENKLLGRLVITVYDEETGDTVPDATVEVTYPDGTKEEYKTGADGKIDITDTDPGDYNIEVKQVPDGYKVTEGKTESATVEPGKTTTHDVYINTKSNSEEKNPGSTTESTPGTGTTVNTPGTGTGTGQTTQTNSTTEVRTGDTNPIALIAALLAVSGLAIAFILYRRKKAN